MARIVTPTPWRPFLLMAAAVFLSGLLFVPPWVRGDDAAEGRTPAWTPEETKAHYELAKTYLRLAHLATQRESWHDELSTERERTRFRLERAQWLKKAAAEYDQLARFLENPYAAGQLKPADGLLIQFTAAQCRIDLSDFKAALPLYARLAVRYRGQPEELKALAGMLLCHARMGEPAKARKALQAIRAALPQLGKQEREEWRQWLDRAEKCFPKDQGEQAPEPPRAPST